MHVYTCRQVLAMACVLHIAHCLARSTHGSQRSASPAQAMEAQASDLRALGAPAPMNEAVDGGSLIGGGRLLQ